MTESAMKAVKAVMPCECHEGYTSRGLVDPTCAWHRFGEDIVDRITVLIDAATKRGADAVCEELEDRASKLEAGCGSRGMSGTDSEMAILEAVRTTIYSAVEEARIRARQSPGVSVAVADHVRVSLVLPIAEAQHAVKCFTAGPGCWRLDREDERGPRLLAYLCDAVRASPDVAGIASPAKPAVETDER